MFYVSDRNDADIPGSQYHQDIDLLRQYQPDEHLKRSFVSDIYDFSIGTSGTHNDKHDNHIQRQWIDNASIRPRIGLESEIGIWDPRLKTRDPSSKWKFKSWRFDQVVPDEHPPKQILAIADVQVAC